MEQRTRNTKATKLEKNYGIEYTAGADDYDFLVNKAKRSHKNETKFKIGNDAHRSKKSDRS